MDPSHRQGSNQLLVGAINESLLSLGEPIMTTIVWHLNAKGIYLDTRKGIDIRSFFKQLEFIIGDIAEVVLDEIYDRLRAGTSSLPTSVDRETKIERIEQLLHSRTAGAPA